MAEEDNQKYNKLYLFLVFVVSTHHLTYLHYHFVHYVFALFVYNSAQSVADDVIKERCREGDSPVGLANLGATCYANSLLQVSSFLVLVATD